MKIFTKIVIILVAILALEITTIYIGYKNNPTHLVASNCRSINICQYQYPLL